MEEFLAQWDIDFEDETKDKLSLYQAMVDKLNDDPENVELLWRLVEACLVVADSFEKNKNKAEAKKYTEESLKYAKKSIEVGPKSFQAHKW